MLAYNRNCWLTPFNQEEQAQTEDLRHTTLGDRWSAFSVPGSQDRT
jgi:hypothetical protein